MLQRYFKLSFFLFFLVRINYTDITLLDISSLKSFTKDVLLSEMPIKNKKKKFQYMRKKY